jgi:hypothetical protein
VAAMRRRFDAVGSEDFPDGGGSVLDGQGGGFAVDAAVAPVRVLSGEPEDERSDAADGRWSTGALGTGCSGVVSAEEVAVPAQDGVGGDDQVELAQLLVWGCGVRGRRGMRGLVG